VFVKKDVQQERQWAVKRVFDGEHIDSICVSPGRSRAWLYKWVERSLQDEPAWHKSQSRRPHTSPLHTSGEIEEIVKIVRLNLYNRDLFCGDQAISVPSMPLRDRPSTFRLQKHVNTLVQESIV
jgi:putative transposase